MEYKFTTPYARFQEWLDQCPVEIVNYVDFTDTFDVTFKVPVEEEVDNSSDYLDSLSEGKDTLIDNIAKGIVEKDLSGVLDDYGSKIDALVDSMGVTDQKANTTHRRKDMDLL